MTAACRYTLVAAALLLALATLLGAYGSHGLGTRDPATLTAFRTAVDYQLTQGLGLLALGWLLDRTPVVPGLRACPVLLVIGVLLFSGGIVVPILGGPSWVGRPVPLGGLLIMAAWLWLAVCVWRAPR